MRFETPAGKQAQLDFARFSFPRGVRNALLVVLGYSRLLWCRFYPRQDMRTLISGLEDAFGYFGGVPQELLFDQLKALIFGDEGMARRAHHRLVHHCHLVTIRDNSYRMRQHTELWQTLRAPPARQEIAAT